MREERAKRIPDSGSRGAAIDHQHADAEEHRLDTQEREHNVKGMLPLGVDLLSCCAKGARVSTRVRGLAYRA